MSTPSIVRGAWASLSTFLQARPGPSWGRWERPRAGRACPARPARRAFPGPDFVAQPGGLLEPQLRRRPLPSPAAAPSGATASCLRETAPAGGCPCGTPPSRSAGCTGAVHWLIDASRQGRNHRQRWSPSSMSSVQVRNLKIFCSTCIAPRSDAGAGKRPVELRAPRLRLPRDRHAGKILAGVNLQVGKGLVVLAGPGCTWAGCP